MPTFKYKKHDINYNLTGEPGMPCIIFVNGLTQRLEQWAAFTAPLAKAGYRVLTYDLLGQGGSSKPVLFVRFEENMDILIALMDHLKVDKAYISGVSFGGLIALKFAIEHPDRVKGLIPMSCFSETDDQILLIGMNLYEGMTKIGFEFLLKQFMPVNVSPQFLAKIKDLIPTLRRQSLVYNDMYAIQNLMEYFIEFKPITEDLLKIKCPALILNGEFDYLTPRWCHDLMRQKIKKSRLYIMQHTFHGFVIEIPDITMRCIMDFVQKVEANKWKGDQAVMIASDDINSPEVAFPCEGDHMRAIPVFKKSK